MQFTPARIHDRDEVALRAAELSRELQRLIQPGFEVFVARCQTGLVEEREWTYVRKDGSRFPVRLSITALRGADDRITGFMGIAADVSEARQAASEQAFQASHDLLTGLANRNTPRLALERHIAGLGIRLSIDDFGTGYFSLGYLRRLPIAELKIDRLFVKDMLTNEQDAVIVRSTIGLAHNLGLKVVAEGVEDATTQTMLRDMGCDLIQGYHLSRPLPADALEAYLRKFEND